MAEHSRAYRYRETDVPFRVAAVFASDDDARTWAAGLAGVRGADAWTLDVRRDGAWQPVDLAGAGVGRLLARLRPLAQA